MDNCTSFVCAALWFSVLAIIVLGELVLTPSQDSPLTSLGTTLYETERLPVKAHIFY